MAIAALLPACSGTGDTLTPHFSASGTVSISASVSGADLPSALFWSVTHPDVGTFLYELTTREIALTSGEWTGRIVDLPHNCGPTTPDPARFSVTADRITEVQVSVQCTAYLGSLRVTLVTVNPSGGFGLNLNGWCRGTVDDAINGDCIDLVPNGSTLVRLGPGSYSVHVTPLTTARCTVSPEDPIVTRVEVGEITDVAFNIDCA